MELHIAVCDDLRTDRERAVDLAQRILSREGLLCRIDAFDSGKALLSAIQGDASYDILLLDVMMDALSGMALAAELRRQGDKTAIVFISSNREMALQGYEVSAVRYLAKPVDEIKLTEALLHCYQDLQEKKEILIPTDHGQYRISLCNIQFIESYDRGTKFVLTDETVETKLRFMDAQATLLRTAFIQCHRTYLVNMAQVKRIRPYEFELKSGVRVPISKYRYSEVNDRFFDYFSS